ncbi:FAD-dependent oxidoreductase [Chloroflexota bacterium]
MNGNGNKEKKPGKIGAVMVVGGGISGMQSALDLANSGFKVYLVEETSSIGGRMSQLDKTFPTNDCSMCMISPKLIEVGKHTNIKLITNARVESIEGESGNFLAHVTKKPRYIDESTCSGCGDCVDVCPVKLPNEFEQGLNTRKATYKRYPQAIPSSFAISKTKRSPCKYGCPSECNGQGYVALISQGKYLEAVNHIKQWITLPSTLGRICHHPCELQCNRGDIDKPVGIAPLKRFVADIVRKQRETGILPPVEKYVLDPTKPRVAVVGSGPSGLTCAYDLAKHGYPVTVFESDSMPGGQPWLAIPEYRLPKDVLAAEIKEIIDAGIELKCNTTIGKDVSLDNLMKQGYKAVYVAIGAQKSSQLAIPGEEISGVLPALDFLRDVKSGKLKKTGKKVVVIGGGNVAVDVARTAVRLGAEKVDMVCLEQRNEMPALHEEVEATLEEGIAINNGWGPKRVTGNSTIEGVEFNKCTSVFDKDKRFSPVYDENTLNTIKADQVIIAIGQALDKEFLTQTGIENRRGYLKADPLTLETSIPGVFAGGDAVTGPKSAVEAIKHGHEGAVSIERYLAGSDLREGREEPQEEAAPIPDGEHEKKERINTRKIPLEKRLSSFDEVEFGYTEDEARAESNRCLNCGLCSECLQCVSACKANAIFHNMEEEKLQIPVGSVVLAPGFEPFDAKIKAEYGYGLMPNVVTSLEFERILSASGPFQGKILRLSDGQHPLKIAWIQCVGSRDETCNRDYCSSVCCMYATKEAIIAKEHESNIQPTIFYNDIRAFGKNFERYYESAQNKFGVRYVKGIPSGIKELQKSHTLLLEHMGEDGKKFQEEFDMVVLSIGIGPSTGGRELANRLKVELDRFGFCKTGEFQPNVTSRPGIFVSGAFETPMDIPEAVINSSSSACMASKAIAEARGTMVEQKIYPPEIAIGDEEPRIGVFVCRCGANIARIVDVPGVANYARSLPHVVHAEENLYTCSTDTQNKIIQAIKDKQLNRVVVASCSPRTHESLFQDTIREAGLNRFLFEMANIRDQCSWVHGTTIPEAIDKANNLVKMAVARAATLKPLQQSQVGIQHTALIIGGGLAGMTAAVTLAEQGFESVLVEKENELGGHLRHLHYTEHGNNPQQLLSDLIKEVEAEPKVKIYKGAQIKETSGYLGNFESRIIDSAGNLEAYKHGIVILATGAVEYQPEEYLYGKSTKVVTQSQLEEKLASDDSAIKNVRSVVMIQCVGSREKDHMYCSRICCSEAIKNARKLKEQNPEVAVYVLYRDIRSYGMHELSYKEARSKGVVFVHYSVDKKPEVADENGKLKVKVYDIALGLEIQLEPDMLVLSAAVRPQPDAEELASKLKLPLTQDKFFMEAHMKLRPLDFVNEGMYLCGTAHAPKFIEESIAQARGAVSRAVTILSQANLPVSGVYSKVDPTRCVACLTCVRSCPFHVPRINEDGVAEIEPAACQGCGICTGACPRKAIILQNYSDEQIMSKVEALSEV